MGLSSFLSPAEGGVLPLLVMNTVLSVALLKNMARHVLHVVGAAGDVNSPNPSSNYSVIQRSEDDTKGRASRSRVSIIRFESLRQSRISTGSGNSMLWCSVECCCVCLCRFRDEEEVSELTCKHFFHKVCLEKWFDKQHRTCPLCRTIL
ncbi:hypothetical protein RJ639_042514 [Escallonia herrerae]|uniref:RING-type domain-containing protein n=1 Tax=Escallonia herrerae TaxID=1293975 RepID=A0AA88WEB0_9ASTE|nr:hypothetical protein RJ639_042514 [Escallonia herrerae]